MLRTFYKRKINLTTVLTLLVTFSVVSTLIILLVSSYFSTEKTLIESYAELNYSKTEKMSESVDSLFLSMRESLEVTANFLEENNGMTDEDIQEQLTILRQSNRYFNSLAWVDETGLVRSLSPVGIGLKGTRIDSGETKKALDAKEPTLTKPFIGPSKRLVLLLSHPLYDRDGNYKGIIAGTIYPQEINVLNEILGNGTVEDNGSYYFVTTPDGELLFHPDRDRIGEDVSENTVIQKLEKRQSGAEMVTNTKDVKMLAGYSYLPNTGWGIVQQTPYSYVEGLLKSQMKTLVIISLFPSLLLLLLAIIVARKVAAPFKRLANTLKQVADGKAHADSFARGHWNREADLLKKNVAIAIDILEHNNLLLSLSAMTDPLTGLANRRKLDEVVNELAGEKKYFSCMMLDIDHFKSVNDTYGHQTGDDVLKELATLLQEEIGKPDCCFRFGGEEFTIILPQTPIKAAYEQAESIRKRVEDAVWIEGRTITISLGIAEYPMHSNSLEGIFTLADQALYRSKREGRNRTTIIKDA